MSFHQEAAEEIIMRMLEEEQCTPQERVAQAFNVSGVALPTVALLRDAFKMDDLITLAMLRPEEKTTKRIGDADSLNGETEITVWAGGQHADIIHRKRTNEGLVEDVFRIRQVAGVYRRFSMTLGSLAGYQYREFEVVEFEGNPETVQTVDGVLVSFIVNGHMTPPVESSSQTRQV